MSKLNFNASFIVDYMTHLEKDYAKWSNNQNLDKLSFAFSPGSSYIKIIMNHWGQTLVHSFIVNKNGKFKIGDILKAASWKAPATNFIRGNILDKNYNRATWCGAL
ncbi:MAG: hypothetical protein WD512_11225 [Candidatus Paceibacterota bacterium]